MISKPIIALDFSNKRELDIFLTKFNEPLFLKIGLEIITRFGLDIIVKLKNKGHQIFIDLKLHDIPNTVEKTVHNLIKFNPDIITVHASGGIDMLKNLKQIVKQNGAKTKIFAVTVLTSNDQSLLSNDLKIDKSLKQHIIDLAQLTQRANLDGVVCSVHESIVIKQHTNSDFMCLTPGIRFNNLNDDQKRTATIKEAIQAKSDYIVVGREITRNNNPNEIYQKIKKEWMEH